VNWLGDNWVDLLGWAGSALLVYSILQTRLLRLRATNLVASSSLLVFNALIEVWPMVAMNATLAAINTVKIFQLMRQQHDDAVFDVIEVRPESLYLEHILNNHRDDIARFQPDLDWQPGRAGSHAFVVVKRDETVGVVLLRAEGDVAHVQLDYVTPRYRDFSPGEFVWRRAGRLRDRGFRQVLTPSNMVDAYYDKLGLGFERVGDHYVLQL
jgi:hypothetical protein